MGREIFALAHAPKTLKTFPGAHHDDHYRFGSYDVLYAWIAALRGAEQQSGRALD